MESSARYRVNSPGVVAETIQGETVAIHLDTGCYYSMRGAAAALWDLLAQGADDAALRAYLLARYDAPEKEMVAAAARFRTQLVAEQLLAPADGAAVSPAPTWSGAREPFAAPVAEKFDDMQDLLLADPIHDVEETGWPHRPGPAAP
jgi:hypothetical protein